MFARFLCALGLHRVVTTREGNTRKGQPAQFIHVYCYRKNCKFRTKIDTYAPENSTEGTPVARSARY